MDSGWTYKMPMLMAIITPTLSFPCIWSPQSSFHGNRERAKSIKADQAVNPARQTYQLRSLFGPVARGWFGTG